MTYVLLLNLHVTADLIWIVSMLAISILIASCVDSAPAARLVWIGRMKIINRFGSTPFMILAWILGITLALQGGWFGANWLSAKLIFVIALSGIHGMQSKLLRTWAAAPEKPLSVFARLFPVFIILFALSVVGLALTKPF